MSAPPAAAPAAGASASGAPLHLHVKVLRGSGFSVTLPDGAAATVAQLQQKIAEERNIPIGVQRLLYKSKVLHAEKKLSEYHMEDGDCLHLIEKAAPTEPTPSPTAAGASVNSDGGGAAPMPPLTPNNAIPSVPPTPFGFAPLGGLPAGVHINLGPQIFGGQPGAAGGQAPHDLHAIVNSMLGSLGMMPQPAPAQQPSAAPGAAGHPAAAAAAGAPGVQPQQRQQSFRIDFQPHGGVHRQVNVSHTPPAGTASAPPASGASGAASPPAAGGPAATSPPGANVHTFIPSQPMLAHSQSHPLLSVNAVRTFLTEVGQNIPRVSSQPPLSMDPRATLSTAAVQTTAFPESLSGLVQLLSQTQAVMTQVAPPIMYRLHNEVQHLTTPIAAPAAASPTHPDTPQTRLALQSQLRQLTPGLRRLGDSLRGLATLLEAVQVNPQTGDASLLILPPHLQPGRQVNITHTVPAAVAAAAGQTPQTHSMVMNFTTGPNGQVRVQQTQTQTQAPMQAQAQAQSRPTTAPGATNATPATGVPSATGAAAAPASAPAPPVNPLMMLMQQFQQPAQAQPQAAQATPTTPAPAPAPTAASPTAAAGVGPNAVPASAPPAFNLMSLLQQAAPMVGPIFAGLQQPPTGGAAAPPNPMAGIMQALGPMFANLQPQPVGPNVPQAASPTAAAPTPAHAAPAAASPVATPSPAQATPAVRPVAPVSTAPAAAAVPPPAAAAPAGVPNISGMLGSLMPMLGQMMNNPGAGAGAGSLQNVIASMMGGAAAVGGSGSSSAAEDEDEDDGSDQPASLFDMFLSTVMQHLSLPDLLGLVSGNWSGVDRVHGPFRELVVDLLAEDESDANRTVLSQSLAAGIVDGMLDEETLAIVAAQRIENGPDPVRISYPLVRTHVRRLLDLILDTPVAGAATAASATPFSSLVKAWCISFCGEWLVSLGRCYRDGLASSERLATALVRHKFATVGGGEMAPFLPMVSGTITSVLMRAAQAYQQEQLAGDDGDAWLAHVPAEHRARWQQTIADDEQTMRRELEERRQRYREQSASGVDVGAEPSSLYKPLSHAYLAGRKQAKRGGIANNAVGAPNAAAAAAAAATDETSPSGDAVSSPLPDTRLADELSRNLRQSIAQATRGTAADEEQARRVVDSLTSAAHRQYVDTVARDVRSIVERNFATDYQPGRSDELDAIMRAD